MRDQGQETLCGVLRSGVRARRASRGRNHVRIEGLSGAARRAVSQPSAPEGRARGPNSRSPSFSGREEHRKNKLGIRPTDE